MKGNIQAMIIFWIGIILAVILVASVYLPTVFTADQSGTVVVSNLAGAETMNNVLVNISRQFTAIPILTNTFTATNTGVVLTPANYTLNSTHITQLDMTYNNTQMNLTYTYVNRSPYTWDAGSIALWTILSLLGVVLVLFLVLKR